MTDDAAEAFLRAVVGPRRRDEPRLADAFRGVDMQMVPTPAGWVAAWRVGVGPAALLVHGWEDDHSLWSPLIDALIERGRAVVACDLPAHGRSEGETGYGSEWADACLSVASALGPVRAIVAHSAGCGPAVMAVREGVAASRLVLVAPALRYGNRWRRVAERTGVSADVATRAQAMYEARLPPARVGFQVQDELPNVAADVLLVHSVDDERMSATETEGVSRKCPRAELFLTSGVSHRRTARAPDVVAAAVELIEPAL